MHTVLWRGVRVTEALMGIAMGYTRKAPRVAIRVRLVDPHLGQTLSKDS
jgi:hypothetical protein